MENEENEDLNIMYLKNQLVFSDVPLFVSFYQEFGQYYSLLDTISNMIKKEKAFLFFGNDFISKLLAAFEIHRFSIPDSEFHEKINELIRSLNDISAYDSYDENICKIDYREVQEKLHGFFSDPECDEEFLSSLAYDAIVYDALEKDEIQAIEDDRYFGYSLKYLLSTFPEMFEEEIVCDRAVQKLLECEKSKKFSRKEKHFFGDTVKRIQKIKMKG